MTAVHIVDAAPLYFTDVIGPRRITLYVRSTASDSELVGIVNHETGHRPEDWTLEAWDSDHDGYFCYLLERFPW